MIDFLFLIPLSPPLHHQGIRTRLQSLCFDQVEKIKKPHLVWYFGEETLDRPYFKRIETQGRTKEERMKEAGELLSGMPQLAKYLIRLDDDDLINPKVFNDMPSGKFDVAYDRRHFFYDMVSGLSSSQKRPWIPNTAVHGYKHALTRIDAVGGAPTEDGKNYLFACDHSQAWHPYYKDKKELMTNKKEPLYVRILNPASITAGANGEAFDEKAYFRYLNGFGTWRAPWPAGMKDVKPRLDRIREDRKWKASDFQPKRGILDFFR